MLSPTQIAARENKLTASRVACLMEGNEAKILNLWRMLVGDPNYQEPDLSGVWPVQLGTVTEELNLAWFQRKYGPVTQMGYVIVGEPDWMACTLDGWSLDHGCPIECKHVGGREAPATIITRYQPQLHWQMLVTGANRCALSVIAGADEPTVDFIPFNRPYGDELKSRAVAFWDCVETMTPPVPMPQVQAPIIPTKIYDMSTSNAWASHAGDWLANKEGKRIADQAEKELKSLVPTDAAKANGHGVQISRARNGNLSLRQQEQP